MIKKLVMPIVKIFCVLFLLFLSYYFFYLKPKLEYLDKKTESVKILSLFKESLTENRVSYVALLKLDVNSPGFDSERFSLANNLKTTQNDITKYVDMYNSMPITNFDLTSRFPTLASKTLTVMNKQKDLLDKVYATKSYQDGLVILRSEEAVKLLTEETNLILEYQWWIEKIDGMQNRV